MGGKHGGGGKLRMPGETTGPVSHRLGRGGQRRRTDIESKMTRLTSGPGKVRGRPGDPGERPVGLWGASWEMHLMSSRSGRERLAGGGGASGGSSFCQEHTCWRPSQGLGGGVPPCSSSHWMKMCATPNSPIHVPLPCSQQLHGARARQLLPSTSGSPWESGPGIPTLLSSPTPAQNRHSHPSTCMVLLRPFRPMPHWVLAGRVWLSCT